MAKNSKCQCTKKYVSSPIIDDCFCGIGSWMHRDRLLPYKTEEIINLMNHFGIRKALVHSNFAADGGSDEHGNQYVIAECNKTNGRLIPALVVRPNPYNDDFQMADYLRLMRICGARAVWLVPRGQSLWAWLYEKIMKECSQRKLPVFIHRDNTTPDQLYNFLSLFPRARIVLCGVGYGEDWWLYPLLHQFQELRVCTGHFYIPTYNPMRFLKHFSATRLIFGSGLPFFSPGGMIAHITYASISNDEKQLIFYKNMENLLNEAEL